MPLWAPKPTAAALQHRIAAAVLHQQQHDSSSVAGQRQDRAHDPVRPGIRGVDYKDLVDIDEAGRYGSDSARIQGILS